MLQKIREKFQHLLSVLGSFKRAFMVCSGVSYLAGCAVILVKAIKAYVVRSGKSVFPSTEDQKFQMSCSYDRLKITPFRDVMSSNLVKRNNLPEESISPASRRKLGCKRGAKKL
jgi:hypothetical protein